MRGDEFLDKMGLIDPAYVEAAYVKPKRRKHAWVKWGAVAACFFLIILVGVFVFRPNVTPSSSLVSFGGITRKYKDVHVFETEFAIIWPWEYKTIAEQYTTITLEGRVYHTRGRSVVASLIGEFIGTFDVMGYDDYTEQTYQMAAQTYQIAGISQEHLVAVQLDEKYYVFFYDKYIPPANLGEVLDDYSLAQTLPLSLFTKYEGYTEQGSFKLNDDSRIWEILNTCRGAKFIGDEHWHGNERAYLSFTATSEALGVYKRVFLVTVDGYIWTNIFDYGYLFQIGEEAAGKIISYSTDNGIESEREPYVHSLAGTLTEVTDDYILVNDTILCSDKDDGMDFKVYLNDLRISRCMDFAGIGVGDIVVVYFTGNIVEGENVVEGAYSLSNGTLIDGEVYVPE